VQLTPEAAFARALEAASRAAPLGALGLAVSGGGDSMALLHLAAGWAGPRGLRLEVATVNHRLRPEAAGEARLVGDTARALGLTHTVLEWRGAPGQGNLQDAARQARQRLLADWAGGLGLDAVALGHTADDQAETFLMRLARGSGVDGLSPMRADWQAQGTRWLRPLLGLSRAGLRDWLGARGLAWVEDPSNDDARFARVRARRALAALAPLGLDVAGLNATATRMGRAREVLRRAAHDAAGKFCRTQSGDVLIAAGARELPPDTFTRLVAGALVWVASAPYRPRYAALVGALDEVAQGQTRSLAGCLLIPEAGGIRICREYQSVKACQAAPGQLWDKRWRLIGPEPGATIAPLGRAIEACPEWRQAGRPRAALMADPAVFVDDALAAAPLAGLSRGWSAEFHPSCGEFSDMLLSH